MGASARTCVAADERSEAAFGCEATVKPEPGIYLNERSIRFYDGCVALGHQTGRSLRPSTATTGKQLTRVHIRNLRSTGIWVSSLRRVTFSRRRKSNQNGLPLAYGLRCAQVPSFRFRSVGTPPRAILDPSRLSRHPCREAHCAESPLGLPMGRVDQDQSPAEAAARPACWRQCVLRNLCNC